MNEETKHKRVVGIAPAMALTIGNMVGVGVFTSLGFQLVDFQSGLIIAILWITGGIYALCGALCYAELTAALPRSGGEYQLLSRIYHPAIGFMSGWLSVTVGFAAPTALAAMAFDSYFAGSISGSPGGGDGYRFPLAGLLALVAGTSIHLVSLRWSSRSQFVLTAGKVLLIALLIVLFLGFGDRTDASFAWPAEGMKPVFSGEFAVSFFFVTYAFSGWNAAAYIAGEIKEPQRSVPVILVSATLVVTVLYVAVNLAMFAFAPVEAMRGQEEVALVAAKSVLGDSGGRFMGGLITFGLLSSIGAMMWAGPRVAKTIGEDLPSLRWFAGTNRGGIPVRAVLLQFVIAAVLLATGSFKSILTYIEFSFQITLGLTVLGVFVLRFREPGLARPYRTFGYPVVPALFLVITAFVATRVFLTRPAESSLGLVTLATGLFLYLLFARAGKNEVTE